MPATVERGEALHAHTAVRVVIFASPGSGCGRLASGHMGGASGPGSSVALRVRARRWRFASGHMGDTSRPGRWATLRVRARG
jgi:hypothetical protein